jgi:hypothetical protein
VVRSCIAASVVEGLKCAMSITYAVLNLEPLHFAGDDIAWASIMSLESSEWVYIQTHL